MPEISKDLFLTRRNKFECVTQSVNVAQQGFPGVHKGSQWEIEVLEHNKSTQGGLNRLKEMVES